MIARIARRLGFAPSVSVALVESWHMPAVERSVIELGPREGASSCFVDQFGRLQPRDSTWSLEITLAAGARWVPMSASDRVKQAMVAPGVLETVVQTPSGPVVQRVAAGVVDGEPVAVVEIENTGDLAVAVGLVARPLCLDGRGYIGQTEIDASTISIEGETAVRYQVAPASVSASKGVDGDLLQNLPDAHDGTSMAAAKCRSGGAQAAAVWPLPHTSTMRFVVELGEATSPTAAIPTTVDINRGWQAHLKQGMRVQVDDLEVHDHLATASRSVLTLWPEPDDTPTAIMALSEMGFGRDAGRLFATLERTEDDAAVLRSLARWAMLGEQAHQLDDLERVLGRLAQAAHGVAARGPSMEGPAWLDAALVALGGRLHQIDQPDVAERVQGFASLPQGAASAADREATLAKALDKRGVWADGQMRGASHYVRAVRSIVAEDTGTELRLLPDLPELWRGRTLDVFGVPVAHGNVSFGLRWHGPRPALLWEATLAPEAPFRLSVPGIDLDFTTEDRSGEVLLADPGWQKS